MKRYFLLHQAGQVVVNTAKRLGINIPEGNVASKLAIRGIPAQAREPLKNPALNNTKGVKQQPG